MNTASEPGDIAGPPLGRRCRGEQEDAPQASDCAITLSHGRRIDRHDRTTMGLPGRVR